jgi:hypothetical protein
LLGGATAPEPIEVKDAAKAHLNKEQLFSDRLVDERQNLSFSASTQPIEKIDGATHA